jgi:hypothetical protein
MSREINDLKTSKLKIKMMKQFNIKTAVAELLRAVDS